ncbi:MAG: hypothetical protein M1834_000867 [Cirrosporium novae-zelandiae]|nr:MAG: hypothetical protein M1834_000867 [Cirrosporium novae-zelandiae]
MDSQTPPADVHPPLRRSTFSETTNRLRSASERVLEYSPPLGMWHATGSVIARAPTLGDIRCGNFDNEGWNARRQRANSTAEPPGPGRGNGLAINNINNPNTEYISERRISEHASTSNAAENAAPKALLGDPSPVIQQDETETEVFPSFSDRGTDISREDSTDLPQKELKTGPDENGVYPNGYKFPPKHTWKESISIGLRSFWKFFLTPFGFIVTIYGLNVVAWGAMIFFLLLNVAPAMCHPTCNDINSPRRVWIEIDSQILNALFCVTGFGLIPWRFRDLYYSLQFRIQGKHGALRKLAGIHNDWFRLPGSDQLPPDKPVQLSSDIENRSSDAIFSDNPAVPIPATKAPNPPPTGIRAPPTALWKLDFLIWMYVLNTVFQIILSGFMWGLNRYDRPSWSTGLFVALGCTVAGVGGIMAFLEGKKVKGIEGVPVLVISSSSSVVEGKSDSRS